MGFLDIFRRGPSEPTTAAVVHHDDDVTKRRIVFGDDAWTAQLRKWNREGPGKLGWYVDRCSELTGSAELYVEQRTDHGTWEETDYGPARAVVDMFRPGDGDQTTILAAMYAEELLAGRHHLAVERVGADLIWHSVASSQIVNTVTRWSNPQMDQTTRVVTWRTSDEAEPGSPDWHQVPLSQFATIQRLDREMKLSTDLRRALPHYRSFVLASRKLDLMTVSRLGGNGIVTAEFPDHAGKDDARELHDHYVQWSSSVMSNPDSVGAHLPFLATTPAKLGYVEVGAKITEADMAMIAHHEAQWAGALPMPTHLVMEGPGNAKWANEQLVQEDVVRSVYQPMANRLLPDLTRIVFWPTAQRLGSFTEDPFRFRLAQRIDDLIAKPDRTKDRIAVAPMVRPTRRALASTVGWEDGDLADDEDPEAAITGSAPASPDLGGAGQGVQTLESQQANPPGESVLAAAYTATAMPGEDWDADDAYLAVG